jgi:hypothetical protein
MNEKETTKGYMKNEETKIDDDLFLDNSLLVTINKEKKLIMDGVNISKAKSKLLYRGSRDGFDKNVVDKKI